jgi:cell division protein FtsQ
VHALSRTSRLPGSGRASQDAAPRPSTFVLPRFMRKPVRYAQRLFHGDVVVPRHFGPVSTVLFLAVTGAYGMVLGGHMPGAVKATTSAAGFAVDNVKVTGNTRTSEIDVLGALDLDGSTSLVGISARAAQKAITQIPWVESADVMKIYPDTLRVVIRERKPFAVWQQDGQLSIIEKDGHVIVPFSPDQGEGLPVVVGEGAQTAAADFVAEVGTRAAFASQIKDYVRVGDRRWNLELKNGVTIELPQREPGKALDRVIALDQANGLLSRDITTVDMRFDDRVVVRLTADAFARREADLKVRFGKPRPGRKT